MHSFHGNRQLRTNSRHTYFAASSPSWFPLPAAFPCGIGVICSGVGVHERHGNVLLWQPLGVFEALLVPGLFFGAVLGAGALRAERPNPAVWRTGTLSTIGPPPTPNARLEAIAAACLMAIVGSILLPKALFVSLDRAILVWLAMLITCGVIIGAIELPPKKVLTSCLLPSGCVPLTYSGFLFVRWLVNKAKNPEAPTILIPVGSGALTPDTPAGLAILAVLATFAFASTYVLVLASAFASIPLRRSMSQLYNFGPSGLRRVQRIIVAICAISGALVLLWGAFGKPDLPE